MALMWQILTFLMKLCFKHITPLAIFTVIIVVILWRKYWKIRRMYDEFPSYTLDLELVRPILWERRKYEHFTNFIFQKIINGCKKFESEGLCVMWGITPYLMLFSEEYVKIISNEEAAVDKMWFYERILKHAFGHGLVTSNGETWKKSRKLAIAALHSQMLKRSPAAFNENAKLLVMKMEAVANGKSEDILIMLKKCAMDCFSESILGVKLKCPENDSKIVNHMHVLPRLFKFSIRRFVFPWLYYQPLLPLLAVGREHWKDFQKVREFSRFVIEEMAKSVSSKTQSDKTVVGGYRKTLSQLLLERYQKDPTFTYHDLQEEVSTFIIAGHDTVSYSMLWCLFMLGHHQDVQDKVYEEIRSISEDDLTFEDASKLTYMTCVIKESMRLYPTVPLYARRLKKEVQCGKYLVPKDTDIVIFSYLLHRNPNCFIDPDKFNPDRFSTSSEVRPWSFIPFSEGIRDCIGKRFAMVEMKVLLTHIIRNFKITSLTQPEDVDLCWDIMLMPARPLLFQLKPRKIANDYS